jgi:hypothetical protein
MKAYACHGFEPGTIAMFRDFHTARLDRRAGGVAVVESTDYTPDLPEEGETFRPGDWQFEKLAEVIARYDTSGIEARARVARESRERMAEAVRACGPGATAYGVQVIEDRTGVEPIRRVYCCRRPEHKGWQPTVEVDPRDPANAMPPGPWASGQDAFGFVIAKDFGDLKAGQVCRVSRYRTSLGQIEVYDPASEEELAEARAKREAKAVEREAEALPLFAGQVKAEGFKLTRKRKRK